MFLQLQLSQYEVNAVTHVTFCYPSYVDPTDILDSVVAFDGRTLTIDMQEYSFIRLNRNNDLFFKPVKENGQYKLVKIDHTNFKVGTCAFAEDSLVNIYNRVMLSQLFGSDANPYRHMFHVSNRQRFGSFYSPFVNSQLLFMLEDDESEVTCKSDKGYGYRIDHNIVYVPKDKVEAIKAFHTRFNALYCHNLLNLNFFDTSLD